MQSRWNIYNILCLTLWVSAFTLFVAGGITLKILSEENADLKVQIKAITSKQELQMASMKDAEQLLVLLNRAVQDLESMVKGNTTKEKAAP